MHDIALLELSEEEREAYAKLCMLGHVPANRHGAGSYMEAADDLTDFEDWADRDNCPHTFELTSNGVAWRGWKSLQVMLADVLRYYEWKNNGGR